MDTKKAIRWLEIRKHPLEDIDGIIELLQRGEKYEKIIKEIDIYFSRKHIQHDKWYIQEVNFAMKYIIEKYFPNEV